MSEVSILESFNGDYAPAEWEGYNRDEIRNSQSPWPVERWRHLHPDEIGILVNNQNTAANWNNLLVTDIFDPLLIRNNSFFGLVRIGNVRNIVLRHHDLNLLAGITNSLVVNCDIGDDCAIHNVQYISHYIVGDRCILFNIMEMNTTDHAKFGNGIIKKGESEAVRVWIDLMNESGSRKIMPFDGMLPADAWIWGKYRDDILLQQRLKEMTQNRFDSRRGYFGTIGNECVIKNSLTLKDLKIGPACYIKGANKLKNLTINSSDDEPSQIGEGVELVNGIIGYGCRIFYGCKAVRFILGNNSNLKYGARLINSFLGDNSTISCCEVLNSLIFPAHEQHHNNSFLVASVILGQSNIAAGATIGSNHNSRSNDSEIVAGRGFWPGLCISLKHSSCFSSFTLIAKADYPAELDIPLPFSLINNNVSTDQLEVMPAFWWMYNMYALVRNFEKFQARDNRKQKVQNIEFDFLAPDTVEEIFMAIRLLERWTAKAFQLAKGLPAETNGELLEKTGRKLLSEKEDTIAGIEILGENMERSSRKVVIKKVHKAYHAYRDMMHHYAVKTLCDPSMVSDLTTFDSMLPSRNKTQWVNAGGQIMAEQDMENLKEEIKAGTLSTWEDVHRRYDLLWEEYIEKKQRHAYAILCWLYDTDKILPKTWRKVLNKEKDILRFISDQVYISRKKDHQNPFRIKMYRNEEEMKATMGDIEENAFINQVRNKTAEYIGYLGKLENRLL
jgi:hypothetical protein